MSEIMIFKAGKYPQGDWPRDRVQKMVDAYDPDKSYEAPVVIGHRFYGTDDEYQDAHGWVQKLRMDGSGKVFAEVPEFSATVKQKIAEKKLRYISVEVYERDKLNESEAPYLRAIALLGRDTPAVPGAKLPTLFSMMTGGGVTTVNEEEHIVAFTRKVDAEEVKTLSQGQETTQEANMDELEKLKAEMAAQQAELVAFRKENDELKNAGKKQEATAFFGKLRDEGKLTPAVFDRAVELDAGLDEAGRTKLRALFGELTPQVNLSGEHAAPKGKAPTSSETDAGLSGKIRAFQKEKGIATFGEAAEAMYAANPKLFEGGEV